MLFIQTQPWLFYTHTVVAGLMMTNGSQELSRETMERLAAVTIARTQLEHRPLLRTPRHDDSSPTKTPT